MPDSSFDVVSKIDLQEVSNAIQQALKEIITRFDLEGVEVRTSDWKKKSAIVLHKPDEYKLKAVNDILQQKLVKRNVSLKGLTYGAVEPAAGGTAKRKVTMQQGIAIEKAREIVKLIKDSKKKAKRGSIERDLITEGNEQWNRDTLAGRLLLCLSNMAVGLTCSLRIFGRTERRPGLWTSAGSAHRFAR